MNKKIIVGIIIVSVIIGFFIFLPKGNGENLGVRDKEIVTEQ